MDFHCKSNYHELSLAFKEDDDGEMRLEGRSSQGPNLSPISMEVDAVLI